MAPRLRVIIGRRDAEPTPGRDRPSPAAAAVEEDLSAPEWPFRRHVTPRTPPRPSSIAPPTILLSDLHRAFPAGQTAGTRLVLTQPTYQLQRWLDWLEAHDGVSVVGVMTRGSDGLTAEALAGRGPWARITLDQAAAEADPYAQGGPLHADNSPLLASFLQSNPALRADACRRAMATAPQDPTLQLVAASVSMEREDLAGARTALELARDLAPDWEAVHFESGKLWLRMEEMVRAADAFAEASRLMPTFAAAFANMGAVLGELERPAEALAALERALELDPNGHLVLNNLGAVHRDAGRLRDAERAFRRTITIAPAFVFGHYNLGQTLLLDGRFGDAVAAYEAGVARDPQRNARQALRLAVARAGAGDTERAVADVGEALERVPAAARAGLAEDAERLLELVGRRFGKEDPGISRVLAAVRSYSAPA